MACRFQRIKTITGGEQNLPLSQNTHRPIREHGPITRLQALVADPRVQVLALVLTPVALALVAGGIRITTGPVSVWVTR